MKPVERFTHLQSTEKLQIIQALTLHVLALLIIVYVKALRIQI